MMGREFEKILKSKLYETKPPSDFIPDWEKFQEFKRKKELEQKRRVVGIVLRIAAGFTILFGVGLGVYQFAYRDSISNGVAMVINNVDTVYGDASLTNGKNSGNMLTEKEINQGSSPSNGNSNNSLQAEPNNISEVPSRNISGTVRGGLGETTQNDGAETAISGLDETFSRKETETFPENITETVPKDITEADPTTFSVKQTGAPENQTEALVADNQPSQVINPEIGPYTMGSLLIAGIVVEKESIQTNEQNVSSYDIDEYLRRFNELYPEQEVDGHSKWSTGLFANALASNVTGLVTDKDYMIGYDYANTKYFNSSYNNEALYTKSANTYSNNVIASAIQSLYDKPLKHKPPLTVSATVGWAVSPKIGLESGVVYSYLYSYYSEYSNFNSYFQKVHYLGIPISAVYYYLPEKSKFNIYNIGGVLFEKSISASGEIKSYQNAELQESEKEKIYSPHVMLSANIGIGLGYDLAPSIALFAESYASYYIFKEGQPVTFKTANPFNVNIRLGMRYIFNAK